MHAAMQEMKAVVARAKEQEDLVAKEASALKADIERMEQRLSCKEGRYIRFIFFGGSLFLSSRIEVLVHYCSFLNITRCCCCCSCTYSVFFCQGGVGGRVEGLTVRQASHDTNKAKW